MPPDQFSFEVELVLMRVPKLQKEIFRMRRLQWWMKRANACLLCLSLVFLMVFIAQKL